MNEFLIFYGSQKIDQMNDYIDKLSDILAVPEPSDKSAKEKKPPEQVRKTKRSESVIARFFTEAGLEVIDQRTTDGNGMLWVVGSKDEIGAIVDEAIDRFGISGRYTVGRTLKTNKGWQNGWCTKAREDITETPKPRLSRSVKIRENGVTEDMDEETIIEVSDGSCYKKKDLIKVAEDIWKYDLGINTPLKKASIIADIDEEKVYYDLDGTEGFFWLVNV